MTKFNVGDKVKIREDLQAGGEYGDYTCTGVMASMAGKELEVVTAGQNYYILEDSIFCWTDEMLEPAELADAELSFTELIEKLPEWEVGTKFEVINEPNCATAVVILLDDGTKRMEWQLGELSAAVNVTEKIVRYKFVQVQPEPAKPEYIAIDWQEALQIIADGGTAYADDKKIAIDSYTYFKDLAFGNGNYVADNLEGLLSWTDWYKKAE